MSINEGDLPYKFGNQSVKPTYLVWSDSHARALYFGIDSIAKAIHVSGYITTLSSRGPLLNVNMKHDGNSKMSDFNSSVLNFIKQHAEVRTVVLIGRWQGYNSVEYVLKDDLANGSYIQDSSKNKYTNNLLTIGLHNTISSILSLNRKVVVTSNIPRLKYDIRNIIGKLRAHHFFGTPIQDDITLNIKYYYEACDESFQAFAKFSDSSCKVIHIEKALMDKDHFLYFVNNRFLYDDQNHLSRYGSLYVAGLLNGIFE